MTGPRPTFFLPFKTFQIFCDASSFLRREFCRAVMEMLASPFPFKDPTDGGNAVLQSLQQRFSQVQSILETNRLLITEINENHESKVPECLTRNVKLIRQLNDNIAKVVDLYSTLSTTFGKFISSGSAERSSIRSAQLPVNPKQKRVRSS